MNISKHTPGPWLIDRNNKTNIFCIGPCIAEEDGGIPWLDVSEADARLIAAAPDLLDALIDCVAVMESELKGLAVIQPELAYAKSAIAKATGEQH